MRQTTLTPTTAASTAPDDADVYESAARDRETRAGRIRRRAAQMPAELVPLRQAMQRRAAELELSAVALQEIASGRRAMAAV